MKKSRYTEEQILYALKQLDGGQTVGDVCRQMGISEGTYYMWKKRYANLGLLEVRELRQLRDENARLKRLVADLTLDRHVLQEVIKKRLRESLIWTPRREQATASRRGQVRTAVLYPACLSRPESLRP
jgi:putative transposase